MQIRCHFQTRASPEQVFDAYTDFSERRLHTWRDTLKPDNYALLEPGPSWAVVREGTLRMGVVVRYEWSEPFTVRWSILESNFCHHGHGVLTMRAATDGGAHVEILITERGGKGASGHAILGLKGLLGPRVLRRSSKRTLDRLAAEGSALTDTEGGTRAGSAPDIVSVMTAVPQIYVSFPGTTRAALQFYADIFGGQLTLHTYQDFGRTDGPPEAIAHGVLDGPISMAGSDAGEGQPVVQVEGLMLSLLGAATPELLHRWFDDLATHGGEVLDPLAIKPWGAADGQVIDRHGFRWLFGYEKQD